MFTIIFGTMTTTPSVTTLILMENFKHWISLTVIFQTTTLQLLHPKSHKFVLMIYSKSTPGLWLMFALELLREKFFMQLSKRKWTLFHRYWRTRRGLLLKRLTDQMLNQILQILFAIHILYKNRILKRIKFINKLHYDIDRE